jgi:peptidyl-prolyl cis-trans isomerase C
MLRTLLLAATAAVLLAGTPAAVRAAPETVVAKVDGMPITEADLALAAEELAGQIPAQATEAQKRDFLVSFVADMKLLSRAAKDAGVDKAPSFERKLAYMREKVLLDEYIAVETKKQVTLDAMKKLYDESIKSVTPEEEARARHILVESEDEAKAIAKRVKGGEDFAKVAGEVSKDPGSGKEGGDLGWFTKDRMVPEFSEAAFKMKPGQVSDPVKSQFGWHVIKLEETRTKPLPSFEEVKDQVEQYLTRKVQSDIVVALRAKGKVERLDAPAPAATPAPAPPEVKKP